MRTSGDAKSWPAARSLTRPVARTSGTAWNSTNSLRIQSATLGETDVDPKNVKATVDGGESVAPMPWATWRVAANGWSARPEHSMQAVPHLSSMPVPQTVPASTPDPAHTGKVILLGLLKATHSSLAGGPAVGL